MQKFVHFCFTELNSGYENRCVSANAVNMAEQEHGLERNRREMCLCSAERCRHVLHRTLCSVCLLLQ